MSERYGTCSRCEGKGFIIYYLHKEENEECSRCGGTGESGNALDHLTLQQKIDHEKDLFNEDEPPRGVT